MPYKNIVFVKFRLELLSDIRFTDKLDDEGKLVFMGLLLLAGRTNNQIPKDPVFIKRHLNLSLSEAKISQNIAKIQTIFPKLIGNSQTLKFKNFNKIHNWLGSAKGDTSETQDKIRREEDKNKNRETLQYFSKKHEEVVGVKYPITYGKDQKLLYDLIDIYDDKTLIALIDEFFAGAKDPKEWWFDKQLSIGMMKTLIPQIINRIRKK